jgi:N-acetylglucosamine kinase-like BadF-type ATPase
VLSFILGRYFSASEEMESDAQDALMRAEELRTPVLGVEGGGSHCHAVVADGSGQVLGIGANKDPANWDDVGIEAAAGAIRSCVTEALHGAGVQPGVVAASVFALAGVDFPMDEQRLAGIPSAIGITGHCRIANDAFASLRAGTDQHHGVVVVAGTGSVVAGRNASGAEFRTLGMGPMLGDSGSASEVSEAAVTAVANAHTGRGPETELTGLLRERSGVGSVVEFLEAASRGRIDTTIFSPEVVLAAEQGDAVAQSILVEAGRSLGGTAAHVVRRLGMQDEPFELVLAGGMFRADTRHLVDGLEAVVRPVAPQVRLQPLRDPPVVGAVLLAIDMTAEAEIPGLRGSLAEGVRAALGHS